MTRPATNNAFAKYRAGHWNFYCSDMAAVVWGWTLSNKLFVIFIIILLLSITTGRTSNEFPVLRKCRTLYVTLKNILLEFKLTRLCRPTPSYFLAHCKAHNAYTQSKPYKELKCQRTVYPPKLTEFLSILL